MSSMREAAEQAAQRGQAARSRADAVLDRMIPEITKMTGSGGAAVRLVRAVRTEVRKNPELGEVAEQSLAGAVMTAAALRLEPGPAGECYLIPYKGEAGFVLGYQGLVKLFYRDPLARSLSAHVVRAGDAFSYSYGLHPTLEHVPSDSGGEITHVYAVASLTTGAVEFEVLTADEVRELRGRLDAAGAIKDPMHWMAKKTAIRQLLKRMPRTMTVDLALASDDELGTALVGGEQS